jgi:hypothetical protein
LRCVASEHESEVARLRQELDRERSTGVDVRTRADKAQEELLHPSEHLLRAFDVLHGLEMRRLELLMAALQDLEVSISASRPRTA